MRRFLTSNCAIVRGELYLLTALGGFLAKMNLKNWNIECCDIIEGFVPAKSTVIIDCLESFQNRLYALDAKGNQLIVFDLTNNKCKYIPLGYRQHTCINFVAFERYGRDYYIFPKRGNKILIFNTNKNTVSEKFDYLDDVDELQCTCRVDDNVWILPQNIDAMYCYHLSTEKKEKYELEKGVRNCVHAIFHNGYVYILNRYGIIYKWDVEKRELQEAADFGLKCNEAESMSRIIYAGNKLILLPAYGNDIRIMDLQSGKLDTYQEYPRDSRGQAGWLKFYGYCADDKYYYFAMCFWNYMLIIDKKSGELIWKKPVTESLGGKMIGFIKNEGILVEGDFEVTDLIRVRQNEQVNECKTIIGKEIYYQIIK